MATKPRDFSEFLDLVEGSDQLPEVGISLQTAERAIAFMITIMKDGVKTVAVLWYEKKGSMIMVEPQYIPAVDARRWLTRIFSLTSLVDPIPLANCQGLFAQADFTAAGKPCLFVELLIEIRKLKDDEKLAEALARLILLNQAEEILPTFGDFPILLERRLEAEDVYDDISYGPVDQSEKVDAAEAAFLLAKARFWWATRACSNDVIGKIYRHERSHRSYVAKLTKGGFPVISDLEHFVRNNP